MLTIRLRSLVVLHRLQRCKAYRVYMATCYMLTISLRSLLVLHRLQSCKVNRVHMATCYMLTISLHSLLVLHRLQSLQVYRAYMATCCMLTISLRSLMVLHRLHSCKVYRVYMATCYTPTISLHSLMGHTGVAPKLGVRTLCAVQCWATSASSRKNRLALIERLAGSRAAVSMHEPICWGRDCCENKYKAAKPTECTWLHAHNQPSQRAGLTRATKLQSQQSPHGYMLHAHNQPSLLDGLTQATKLQSLQSLHGYMLLAHNQPSHSLMVLHRLQSCKAYKVYMATC